VCGQQFMNTTMAQYLAWIYSRTATMVPRHLEAIVFYLRPCQHFVALRTAIVRSQQHQHCVLHRGSTLHTLVTRLHNSNRAHLHHYYGVTRPHCQAAAHRHRCRELCVPGHVCVVLGHIFLRLDHTLVGRCILPQYVALQTRSHRHTLSVQHTAPV